MKGKQHLDHAILLSSDEEITLERYIATFSPQPSIGLPELVCPVCRGEIHLSRMHDRNRTPTFLHVDGDQADCPLVNVHFASTAFAVAHTYEPRLEQERRERFMERWTLYLTGIRRHVSTYSVERFAMTIAHADVLHIWSCPTLTEVDILYLFLAFSAFVAEPPGAHHPIWLRFLFDASVSGAADLQPADRRPPRFFRLRYRSPYQVMFPNAHQLLDWCEIPMTDTFLRRPATTVSGPDLKAFAELTALRPSALEDDGPTIPIPDPKK
ncbi:hypothetical protein CY652_13770 [Burkholderia sp. WAC0059]|uniref:hypothetical protein n=1 Tax=Burkholderia sp. WAC0059 TaxID=2066022 RepID=UPI000C7EF664|nr:hypothetical protein [Burkholderia sp. WAC0059]PLZ01747.1 hypothetical protein CY652_13770 [Burkholderia sp. WAC0059]